MQRPVSIVNFERCYLGAIAVGLINTALNWQAMMETTQMRQATVMFGSMLLPISVAIGLAISGLLWFFAARKGSAVAKWIIVVLFGFSVLGMLGKLFAHSDASALQLILGVVAFALNGVAVWMLFRPDTKAWFGETGTGVV
jgi:hypothetical protein